MVATLYFYCKALYKLHYNLRVRFVMSETGRKEMERCIIPQLINILKSRELQ